jgi:uncharacterized linocin/CFP29 family protein
MDYILNGQAVGNVASTLLDRGGDPRAFRPFIGNDGRHYMDITDEYGKPQVALLSNATATLRKDEWKQLDDAIVEVARNRLKAVADLRSMGLVFNVPNGMGTTILETETMSDINDADVDMDGLTDAANDRPVYELTALPLPIIHKNFSYSSRQIATSRQKGSPIDTTSARIAARKVAEEAEKLLVGVSTVADQFAYGGGTIYGYTDFPSRLTRTITAPTASGWTGTTFLNDVVAMRQQAQDAFHYGPYVLYVSNAWDQYLDNDFKAESDITIRERIMKLTDISDVKTLDYLPNFDIVLVQMSQEVVREVIGMEMMTLQWPTNGGLLQNYKVMAILVPQLRADQNGNTGIVHGSV